MGIEAGAVFLQSDLKRGRFAREVERGAVRYNLARHLSGMELGMEGHA